MGVGISPERGERAERANGGRPERIPEPETELLVGRVAETGVSSGRRPERGPASGGEPGARPSSGGRATASPWPFTRTSSSRPFLRGAPASGRGSASGDGPPFGGGSPLGGGGSATDLLEVAAPDRTLRLSSSRRNRGETADEDDPHEVVIRLDGVDSGPEDRPDPPGHDLSTAAEIADRPVFVDASGRRSRRFRRLGMLVAAACAVYAVVIVATLLSGNSNAPWLPVPGQEEDTPAGQVETSTLPTQSVNPAGKGAVPAPGTTARAADGTTPSPTRSAKAGASASASAAGASGTPEPSTPATKKPKPGVSTKAPGPGPKPSTSPDGQPSASATTTPPGTPAPTESTGATGAPGAGAAPNG